MWMDALAMVDEWGPEKVICVSDWRTGMKGVLVIDNTARGMGKGGTRMGLGVTVPQVARLARTMTWKWAAVDLYFGGAKAGIVWDPSGPGKEAALRSFARALVDQVPREYVFGLDLGLTERDAAVLADEIGDRGAAVGLPRALGGLPYDELGVTGHGVAEVADVAASRRIGTLVGARVAIQGFGAVGAATARRLDEMGAQVIAVSTAAGHVRDDDGLDIDALLTAREHVGDRCVYEMGLEVTTSDDIVEGPSDMFVPAACEDTIDTAIASRLDTAIVVEGANLATSEGSRARFRQRGIDVVPDFIANAGGVIAAAHSMDHRRSPFPVESASVFKGVSSTLRANTAAIFDAADRYETDLREAALDLARSRVRAAMELRFGTRLGVKR